MSYCIQSPVLIRFLGNQDTFDTLEDITVAFVKGVDEGKVIPLSMKEVNPKSKTIFTNTLGFFSFQNYLDERGNTKYKIYLLNSKDSSLGNDPKAYTREDMIQYFIDNFHHVDNAEGKNLDFQLRQLDNEINIFNNLRTETTTYTKKQAQELANKLLKSAEYLSDFITLIDTVIYKNPNQETTSRESIKSLNEKIQILKQFYEDTLKIKVEQELDKEAAKEKKARINIKTSEHFGVKGYGNIIGDIDLVRANLIGYLHNHFNINPDESKKYYLKIEELPYGEKGLGATLYKRNKDNTEEVVYIKSYNKEKEDVELTTDESEALLLLNGEKALANVYLDRDKVSGTNPLLLNGSKWLFSYKSGTWNTKDKVGKNRTEKEILRVSDLIKDFNIDVSSIFFNQDTATGVPRIYFIYNGAKVYVNFFEQNKEADFFQEDLYNELVPLVDYYNKLDKLDEEDLKEASAIRDYIMRVTGVFKREDDIKKLPHTNLTFTLKDGIASISIPGEGTNQHLIKSNLVFKYRGLGYTKYFIENGKLKTKEVSAEDYKKELISKAYTTQSFRPDSFFYKEKWPIEGTNQFEFINRYRTPRPHFDFETPYFETNLFEQARTNLVLEAKSDLSDDAPEDIAVGGLTVVGADDLFDDDEIQQEQTNTESVTNVSDVTINTSPVPIEVEQPIPTIKDNLFIESKEVSEYYKEFRKKLRGTAFEKQVPLFNSLVIKLQEKSVKVFPTVGNSYYSKQDNTIYVNSISQPYQVVEELIHAFTFQFSTQEDLILVQDLYNQVETHMEILSKKDKKTNSEILALSVWKSIKNADANVQLHEFMAKGLSSKTFSVYLKSIEYNKESFLKRLVDAVINFIKDALNITPDNSIYTNILSNLTNRLLNPESDIKTLLDFYGLETKTEGQAQEVLQSEQLDGSEINIAFSDWEIEDFDYTTPEFKSRFVQALDSDMSEVLGNLGLTIDAINGKASLLEIINGNINIGRKGLLHILAEKYNKHAKNRLLTKDNYMIVSYLVKVLGAEFWDVTGRKDQGVSTFKFLTGSKYVFVTDEKGKQKGYSPNKDFQEAIDFWMKNSKVFGFSKTKIFTIEEEGKKEGDDNSEEDRVKGKQKGDFDKNISPVDAMHSNVRAYLKTLLTDKLDEFGSKIPVDTYLLNNFLLHTTQNSVGLDEVLSKIKSRMAKGNINSKLIKPLKRIIEDLERWSDPNADITFSQMLFAKEFASAFNLTFIPHYSVIRINDMKVHRVVEESKLSKDRIIKEARTNLIKLEDVLRSRGIKVFSENKVKEQELDYKLLFEFARGTKDEFNKILEEVTGFKIEYKQGDLNHILNFFKVLGINHNQDSLYDIVHASDAITKYKDFNSNWFIDSYNIERLFNEMDMSGIFQNFLKRTIEDSTDIISLSGKNANNDNEYYLKRYNALTLTIKQLNDLPNMEGKNSENAARLIPRLDTPFNKQSTTLAGLDSKTKIVPYIVSGVNFNYAIEIDGKKEPLETRNTTADLSVKDKFIQEWHMVKNNMRENIRAGSKSSAYGFGLQDQTGNFLHPFLDKTSKQTEREAFYDKMMRYFRAEVKSVSQGNKPMIFTFLSEDVIKGANGLEDKLDTLSKYFEDNVRPTLSKVLQKEVQDLDAFIEDNVSNRDESLNIQGKTEDDRYKDYETSLISFVYKKIVFGIEEVILIHGHPVNFSDFFKRVTTVVSDGTPAVPEKFVSNYMEDNYKNTFAAAAGIEYDNDYESEQGLRRTGVLKEDNRNLEKDLPQVYEQMIEGLKSIGKSREEAVRLLKPYTNMNIADGQGYITPDAYREYMILMSNWSPELEDTFIYLVNKEKRKSKIGYSTPEEIEEVDKDIKRFDDTHSNGLLVSFPPLKIHYRGNEYSTKNNQSGVKPEIIDKFSVVPIFPDMARKYVGLQHLYNEMLTHKVGYTKYASGTKGSSFKEDQVDLYNGDSLEDKWQVIKAMFLKEQVKTNFFVKKQNLFGTQFRTLITAHMLKEGNFIGNYEELYNEYKEIIDNLTKIAEQKLLNDLGMESFSSPVNFEKLFALVQAELEQRELPDEFSKALKLSEGKPEIALELFPQRDIFEKILRSLVEKRITKQKVNGGQLIQVSNSLFENVEEIGKEGTGDLKFYTRTEKDGKVVISAAECKVAFNGDFKKLLRLPEFRDFKDKQGNKVLGRISQIKRDNPGIEDYEIANILIKEGLIDIKSLSLTAYRIPTQDFNSLDAFIIKEFLPEYYGNVIIPPAEIVAKSGSDFDIDKMSVVLPNLDENGNYIDTKDYKQLSKEKLESLRAKKKELESNELFVANKTKNALFNKINKTKTATEEEIIKFNTAEKLLKDQDQQFKSLKKNYLEIVEVLELDKNYYKSLQNKLITSSHSILLNENSYPYLITPNDNTLIKQKILYWAKILEPDAISEVDGVYNISKVSGFDIIKPSVSLKKHDVLFRGKNVLGVMAIANKTLPLYQHSRLLMQDTCVPISKALFNSPEKVSNISIFLENTEDGTSKQEIHSQTINASVDIESDAYLGYVNLLLENAGAFNTTIQKGIDLDKALGILNQPIVLVYHKHLKRRQGESGYQSKALEDTIKEFGEIKDENNKVVYSHPILKEKKDPATFKPLSLKDKLKDNRPKKITLDDLINGARPLTNLLPISKEESISQIEILAEYLQIMSEAETFRTLVSNINTDTKPSGNVMDVQSRIFDNMELIKSGLFDEASRLRLRDESIISSLNTDPIIQTLFSTVFPNLYFPKLLGVVKDRMVQLPANKRKDFVRKVFQDFVLAMLQNTTLEGKSLYGQIETILIRGKEQKEFADTFRALQKKHPNNRFLKDLIPSPSKYRKPILINYQIPLSFDVTKDDKDQLTREWKQLDQGDTQDKDFAIKMAIMSLVVSGQQKSAYYMSDIIPEELIHELLIQAEQNLNFLSNRNNGDVFFKFWKEFESRFKLNNPLYHTFDEVRDILNESNNSSFESYEGEDGNFYDSFDEGDPFTEKPKKVQGNKEPERLKNYYFPSIFEQKEQFENNGVIPDNAENVTNSEGVTSTEIKEDNEEVDSSIVELKPITKVIKDIQSVQSNNPNRLKDIAMFREATGFIGFETTLGDSNITSKSSTKVYRESFGNRSNRKVYTNKDVIAVSGSGNFGRSGKDLSKEIDKDFKEKYVPLLDSAIEESVTFLVGSRDNITNRQDYNIIKYLESNGYKQTAGVSLGNGAYYRFNKKVEKTSKLPIVIDQTIYITKEGDIKFNSYSKGKEVLLSNISPAIVKDDIGLTYNTVEAYYQAQKSLIKILEYLLQNYLKKKEQKQKVWVSLYLKDLIGKILI